MSYGLIVTLDMKFKVKMIFFWNLIVVFLGDLSRSFTTLMWLLDTGAVLPTTSQISANRIIYARPTDSNLHYTKGLFKILFDNL